MSDGGKRVGRWFAAFLAGAVSLFRISMEPVRWVLHWIGQHALGVLVSLAIAALGIWGFVKIADEVREGSTAPFDVWAVGALRSLEDPAKPIGPGWIAEVARDITALGGLAVLVLLIASVCGFLWLRRLYGPLILISGASLSGLLVSLGLKELYDRPRPALSLT